MRVFPNGLAQRCSGNHVKGALIEASYRTYCRFVTTPHLPSAPLSAVGTLGENGPMFSGTRASSKMQAAGRQTCRQTDWRRGQPKAKP